MQTKTHRPFSIIKSLAKSATIVPALLVLVTAQSVFATTYYWDANGGTAGTGGSGTWDASSLLWRNGSSSGTLEAWPNTDPNTDFAQLAGTAGTITLNTSSVNINVNKIVFGTTGYTIAAPGSGTATLNLSGTTPTIDTGALPATISAKITGSAGLTKSGTGELTLSGASTYTGVTAIGAGTGPIIISSANALGSSAGGSDYTTIAASGKYNVGPVLRLTGNITSAENITISGATEVSGGYNGAIYNQSGNNTLSGNITLSSPTGDIRLQSAGGSLTFSGNIGQTGTTRTLSLQANNAGSSITVNNLIANNGGNLNVYGGGGATTVTLKGVSGTGIGTTTISQAGNLKLGVTDALNTTANLTIGTSGADQGTLDLAGYNQTVYALIAPSGGNTNHKVINSVTGTSRLTVGNGGGSGTFYGQLQDGGAGKILALTKTGSGTQTLVAGNTYTGGTIVNDGTLQIGASDALANAGTLTVSGGIFGIQTFNDTVGAFNMSAGSLNGSGTLTAATYGLTGGTVNALLGAGAVTVDTGTVTLGAAGRLNSSSSLVIQGGQLTLAGNETVSSYQQTGGTLAGTGNTLTSAATYDMQAGTVSANLGGSVGFTKTGSGVLTLSGVNTYTGATALNDGTLLVNGSIASAVTVGTAGILGGTGSVTGNVTVATTGSVSPGSGGAGTLSIDGALDISAMAGDDGKLIYELAAINTSDKIAVTGALTMGDGELGFSDFTFSSSGSLDPGTYKLITTTAGITVSLDNADLVGVVGSQNVTLQITGNDLELVVASSGTVFKFR